MFDIEINENLTQEDKDFFSSKKHLRNMNAFFREDIGIWKAPHPEVDNFLERKRSKIVIKGNGKYDWISRNRRNKKNLK